MNAQSPETPHGMAGGRRENAIPSIDLEDFEILASQFRVLGEPVRLKLLNALKRGEKTVNELAAFTRTTQANASKHLRILTESGFAERQKRSSFVYYFLVDDIVDDMCDTIKLKLQRNFENKSRFFCGRRTRERSNREFLEKTLQTDPGSDEAV